MKKWIWSLIQRICMWVRKLPIRLLLPAAFLLLTIVFGGLAASSGLEGFWKATGLLTGETSYEVIKKFAQLEGATDTDESADARDFSTGRQACLWIARILGMAFILSTLNVLMFEQLREPVRRIRVFRWWVSSWLWHFVVERCLRRADCEVRWDYVLICGLGWKGREIAANLRQKGRKVSVIEKDSENASIETVKLAGAKVFIGDATDAEMLRKAGARHAREIYVVAADDEMACRIIQQIESTLADRITLPCEGNKPLDKAPCVACGAPKAVRIHAGVEGYRSRIFLENCRWNAPMYVSCFNMEELIARELFRKAVWPQLAVAGRRHMAFYILGWTPMARELLLHVLRSAHLYQDQERDVVVFCEEPEKRKQELLEEFPCLRPEAMLSLAMRTATAGVFPPLRFEKLPRSNAGLLAADFALYAHIQPGWQTHVFYCIDGGVKSESIATLVQPRLQWFAEGVNKGGGEKAEVHSHVYYNYPEEYGVGCVDVDPERETTVQRVTGPYRFGAYNHFCRPEMIAQSCTERYAKATAAHFHALYPKTPKGLTEDEMIAAKCAEKKKLKILLDVAKRQGQGAWPLACYFDRLWERSAEWERESNRQAAAHMPVKLALLGTTMDNIKTEAYAELEGSSSLPEVEHRRWCAERLMGGWLPLETEDEKECWKDKKTHCPVMKDDLRLHGDLVPYDALSSGEKEKDSEIIRTIALRLECITAIMEKVLNREAQDGTKDGSLETMREEEPSAQ